MAKIITREPHIVGQTKAVGFEIGVRKTFDVAPEAAWTILTSEKGLRLWLGELSRLPMEKGESYQTADGTTGEIRATNPGGHIRLTWQPRGWRNPSTLQVRVIPSGVKTTISFHQERLSGAEERERMRDHWKRVMAQLSELFL